MEFEKLHDKFKDKNSPSFEAQKKWLRKKGFSPEQIDRAMLVLYGDIERGQMPMVFEGVKEVVLKKRLFGMHGSHPPDGFEQRPISNGVELDNCLLEYAKHFRDLEEKSHRESLQEFEKMLRKRWMSTVPWYKRIFGVKPKE